MSDGDFAQDCLTFGKEGAFEIFLASDDRFVDGCFGADDGGFSGANDDALVLRFLFQGRGVELTKGFPFFHECSFCDDRQDRGTAAAASFDFAFHFVVAARFDLALFQDDVIEGAFGDLVQHWFFRTLVIHTFLVLVPPITAGGEARESEQAEDSFFHDLLRVIGVAFSVFRSVVRAESQCLSEC